LEIINVDFETQNQNPDRLCDVCGERPGVVQVMFAGGGGRRTGLVCERCAREAIAAQHGGSPFGSFAPGGPRGMAGAGPSLRQRRPTEQRSQTPGLDEFGRDLTQEARAGRIDPVIGRDPEIAQVIEVLARRRKNNAALIGEAGVGKTALAEGLALRVASGEVPEELREVRVVALDLAGMIAGSQYRGAFEQRLKGLLDEVVVSIAPVTLGAGRPLLINLAEPGRLEPGGWSDRVNLVETSYDGDWELPVIGPVQAPHAVLVRPDGYVAWVDVAGSEAGLEAALSTWFGPRHPA
jgi:hypothetical protein